MNPSQTPLRASLQKIALANLAIPASREESVVASQRAIGEAGAAGARIVCFPECFVPGYRGLGFRVAPPDAEFLERAWRELGDAAKQASVTVVLGTERLVDGALLASALVLNADGTRGGFQDKVQIDPSEEGIYAAASSERQVFRVADGAATRKQPYRREDRPFPQTPREEWGTQSRETAETRNPGSHTEPGAPGPDIKVSATYRQVFHAGPITFGITICHEGWRYPETVRWPARQGAQIVFHPHFSVAEPGGYVPSAFCDPANTFHEKAALCRAAENTCYFATVNCASAGSPTTSAVVNPDGTVRCWQPYGRDGLLVVEIDLDAATGLLARRLRPTGARS